MKTPTELPSCGEHVIVHCNGFRCMGKLENNGKWRAAFRDDELTGVIAWSPVDDDRVIPLAEAQAEAEG
jgi:hypothetical protein